MSTRKRISNFLDGAGAMLLDPEAFDDAIIGIARRADGMMVVAYDRQRCIEVLLQDGMDHGEAEEFFEFNTAGAWVGEGTPVFIDTRWAE